MTRLSSIALAIAFGCAVASAQPAAAPDSATVNDGIYTNHFFHFSYTYPKGWIVHGQETAKYIIERGKEKMVNSGALSKAESESSMKGTYQILTVLKHPLGTPGITSNPLIQVVVEDVRYAPGISDGRAYLFNLRLLLTKTGSQFIQEQPVEMKIGARQFFRQDYRTPINNVVVQQALVIGYERGYVLVFIFSSTDPAEVEEMLASLKTLTFKSVAPAKP
jgi:hypothetical protein